VSFVQLRVPFTARDCALTVTTLSMYPLAANVAALRLTTIGSPGVPRLDEANWREHHCSKTMMEDVCA
jgi:hypothetical protein